MENNIEKYGENSIRTFTGKIFDLKILDPDSICIEDIAHSLSQTPRFGGHLKYFYSVAQHSMHVCNMVEDKYKLGALLHDASEAYIGDMPSPFKKILPDYIEVENNIMEVIAKKYGFLYPLHYSIKVADKKALNNEWDKFVIKEMQTSIHKSTVKELFIEQYKILI